MKLPPLLLAAVLCLAAPASAQTWIPIGGPPGGDVRSLAVDPRHPLTVYLGTAGGVVYRSDNGGAGWQRLTPGFPQRGMSLDEMVVTAAGEVLVGYWEISGSGGGVARSSDGGRTFRVMPEIEGQSVRALAVTPEHPDILVAGAIGGVFRSEDGGDHWRRISPEGHAELRNIESIALDPGNPAIVYAGTWHLPWKTTDAGRTWSGMHAGIIDDSDIFTLILDRRTPRTVYATACSGIYRSANAGASFAKIRGIPSSSRRTRAFAQDPDRSEVLYAGTTEGLWMSEDDGASWRLATRKELVVNAIARVPGALLLGTDGLGVLRSIDAGRTWSAANDGFSERFVTRLLLSGNRVLAAVAGDRMWGGVFEAASAEGPWRRISEGLEGREVQSLALAGSALVAGTDDGIFLSDSARSSWSRLPTVVDGLDMHPWVADVAAVGDRILLGATPHGLLRSVDAGRSWTQLQLGLARSVSALAVAASDPKIVIAATPLGTFRSEDQGASWSQVAAEFADAPIRRLLLLPGDDRVVFATTPKGLYKSVDQGHTWYRRGGGLPQSDITGLAADSNGRTLYASDFALGGVYRSDDAGLSWREFPTAGLLSERVWAVAADPARPGRLYAATPGGGLHALAQ